MTPEPILVDCEGSGVVATRALRSQRARNAPAAARELPAAPAQWASGAEWLARARDALATCAPFRPTRTH